MTRDGRILVLEDEASSARALELFFQDQGLDVRMAAEAPEALELAASFEPHVLVTDVLLKSAQDGLEVAEELKERDPSLEVVVMTGLPHSEIERRVSRVTDLDICFKPIRLVRLLALVEAARARHPALATES